MSLTGTTDPAIVAVLALLRDAMNADLDTGDEPAVVGTYAWPMRNPDVQDQQLPALFCWRRRQAFAPRMVGPHDRVITLQLTYLMPPATRDNAEAMWAHLQASYDVAADALFAGHHEAHEGDAAVLEDAGFIDIDITAPADFAPPPLDADPQHRWDAAFVVTLRTSADTSDLADLSHETRVFPAELPEGERADFAAEIHELP